MKKAHINSESARERFIRFVSSVPLDDDTVFTWRKYHRDRSLEQNALSHALYKQAAEQFGDRTPQDVRRECKLRYGVPILRGADPEYCAAYDKAIKPHSYEDKLQMMDYWPVTRLMTVDQMQYYLDTVMLALAGQGCYFDV